MTPQQLEEIKARLSRIDPKTNPIVSYGLALLDEVERLRATGQAFLAAYEETYAADIAEPFDQDRCRKAYAAEKKAIAAFRSALSPDGGGEGEQTQKETGHE